MILSNSMKRRNTISKDAVLGVLASTRKALSHDAVEKQLNGEVDRATIYRILNRFCEDGVVHRITADDGKQYFAICKKCEDMGVEKNKHPPDNHFHFRCTNCQTIECLPALVEYKTPNGYNIDRLNCVLIGTCKDCRK
ncbi:MAG: Fur family transcriptional regulator [Flavipsychrobacter sp.]